MNQLSERDERMFSTFAHLGILAGFLPSANVLVPLIIWLTQRDKSEFVDYHAKEALNFQISISLLMIGAGLLSFILIGIPLVIMLALACLVFSIIAAVKANQGEMYEYPFNLRLIK
ncbi:MAG: DUF4870 domain-containing protein [Saprospiraceae bacterium]